MSHIMNGLLSFSIDQLLPLNREGFSILKRESIAIVVCSSKEDNLLCSDKNSSFLFMFHGTIPGNKRQGVDEILLLVYTIKL